MSDKPKCKESKDLQNIDILLHGRIFKLKQFFKLLQFLNQSKFDEILASNTVIFDQVY